jgi:CRP-like cAMP-binding protein
MAIFSGEPASRNAILGNIPREELLRIWPVLTRVRLVPGQVLQETDEHIDEIYFVEEGLVSMATRLGDSGDMSEVDSVGRHGAVGLAALLNPNPVSFYHSVVQMPGIARRIPVPALRDALPQATVLRQSLFRALEVGFLRLSLNVACISHHSLSGRLARTLLMLHDVGRDETLDVTQEFLARMLGVRRPSVTITIGALESSGVIRIRRGHIAICDRPGLIRAACDCYGQLTRHVSGVQETASLPRPPMCEPIPFNLPA